MARLEFVCNHVSSFVIICSFCDKQIRRDVLNSNARCEGSGSRTQNDEYNTKLRLNESALKDGWRCTQTSQLTILNICPEHVAGAIEMGILPDDRPTERDVSWTEDSRK